MSAAAVRKNQVQPLVYDLGLLFPVLLLVGLGIVMVYSASSALAFKDFGSGYFFLKKQALFSLIGIVVLVLFSYVPFRLYRVLTYPALIITALMLVAVAFSSMGVTAGGSSRWLQLGPLRFQPSELARLALVIYLAYSMSKKDDLLRDFYVGFLPHVMVLGLFVLLLVVQPDFGSMVIFALLTWIMLFVGGCRISHLLMVVPVLAPMAWIFMTSADYRVQRLLSFLDPWKYRTEGGYQIVHSFMAFGTGGITGVGLGKGYQKLFYLPEPHTDFIFSVIGEELGLIGVLVVILLYGIMLMRGIHIARHAQDRFGAFLAMGITVTLGLQVCINMGVALGLLPTKGLTLPFLSYGGTSLLINMAAVGIMMNIGARDART
ncbi:putative lipid II flippase FtsW [Desulfosarcina ovata subsp. sediminis]|uniref:Probable peptidoglycan glycosyltransferase FtsW n=1 Tax=Desulfosarcina ovata subsp. sediminis TaxID=885957 RepID=A0A5K7ZRX1_9BACT|nr:putative lipid II flippase FtsW [Desulfosarcina ovata]BBO82954.1 putative lipid II flippase FtsW [Desulfosarcina ovata subsp. sediminis]